jgi:hypothetical protein
MHPAFYLHIPLRALHAWSHFCTLFTHPNPPINSLDPLRDPSMGLKCIGYFIEDVEAVEDGMHDRIFETLVIGHPETSPKVFNKITDTPYTL